MSHPRRKLIGNRLLIPSDRRPIPYRSIHGSIAYDAKRSAENGQPTYCIIGKMRRSDFERASNAVDPDSRVIDSDSIVHHEDETYVIIRHFLGTRPLNGADPLGYYELNGAKLVILWEIFTSHKLFYAQDLSYKKPTFVAVSVEHRSSWEQTRTLYKRSRHPNIVKYYKHVGFGHNAILITDYPGTDILTDMEENFQEYLKDPELVKNLLLQLIDVTNYLHDNGYFNMSASSSSSSTSLLTSLVYSGIDPRNILISEDRKRLYLSNLSCARRLWTGLEPNWQKRNQYHPWSSQNSLSCGLLMKDVWGIRMMTILLSHPHLPQIWLLNDPEGHTFSLLEACFDQSIILADNLPISNTVGSLLLDALHPNPRLRTPRKLIRSSLDRIPLNSFIQSHQEILDSEFPSSKARRLDIWYRSTYDCARLLYLIPNPERSVPAFRNISYYGSVFLRAVVRKEGCLPPLCCMIENKLLADWTRSISSKTLRRGNLDPIKLEVILDLMAWSIATHGPHLLPQINFGKK